MELAGLKSPAVSVSGNTTSSGITVCPPGLLPIQHLLYFHLSYLAVT